MDTLRNGFNKIITTDCQFYQDGRDFLRYAAKQALELNSIKSEDTVKHKISLITGYTGLNFLLLSILRASIPNERNKEHVIYKRKLEVKNSKLVVSESSTTIDTDELIKRLSGCNYNLENIKTKIKSLANIRNNIIHHFNDKPNNELINYIVTIFLVVKEIIKNPEDFWGDSWSDLNKNSKYLLKINESCLKSYEKNRFTPHPYYFNCLSCGSTSLSIKGDKQEKIITCETCDEKFAKSELLYELSNSGSYRYSHQVISLLEVFRNNFSDEDKSIIHDATNNPQVGDIINDDDVNGFYYSIFGD